MIKIVPSTSTISCRCRWHKQNDQRCTGHCVHILEVMFFVDVNVTLVQFWYTYSVVKTFTPTIFINFRLHYCLKCLVISLIPSESAISKLWILFVNLQLETKVVKTQYFILILHCVVGTQRNDFCIPAILKIQTLNCIVHKIS